MKSQQGLTIVQTMIILFIVGIVGWFIVDHLVDERCEGDSTSALCVERKAAQQ